MLLKIQEIKKWPLRKPGMPRQDLVTHLYLMPLHGLQSKPIGKVLLYPETCLYLVLEHSTASKADLLSFHVGGLRSFQPPWPLKLLEELWEGPSFRVSPLPVTWWENVNGPCAAWGLSHRTFHLAMLFSSACFTTHYQAQDTKAPCAMATATMKWRHFPAGNRLTSRELPEGLGSRNVGWCAGQILYCKKFEFLTGSMYTH